MVGGAGLSGAGRPQLRPARPGDLDRLGPLYQQAGFSPHLAQVAAFARDRLGGPMLVAEAAGELAGVAGGALFDGTGWVGGVAVAPAHRRAGLGGALTAAVVESLEAGGAGTVLLHATDLGRPIYQRLGFLAEGDYLTLAGPVRPGLGPAGGGPRPRAGRAEDLAAVLALDRAATGEDRRRLLEALWPAGCLIAADGGPAAGFHLASPWRPGGATLARDPAAGLALLAAVAARHGGELTVSVPAANTPAVQALRAAGLAERYRTTRMHRGPAVAWQAPALFAAHTLFWG